jgi:hypothetical protein
LRVLVAALTLCGMALLAVPAHSQQVVETSTGKHVAGGNCSVSEPMLSAIQNGDAIRKAQIRARMIALLDSALARPKSRLTAQSLVVFPLRPGS